MRRLWLCDFGGGGHPGRTRAKPTLSPELSCRLTMFDDKTCVVARTGMQTGHFSRTKETFSLERSCKLSIWGDKADVTIFDDRTNVFVRTVV